MKPGHRNLFCAAAAILGAWACGGVNHSLTGLQGPSEADTRACNEGDLDACNTACRTDGSLWAEQACEKACSRGADASCSVLAEIKAARGDYSLALPRARKACDAGDADACLRVVTVGYAAKIPVDAGLKRQVIEKMCAAGRSLGCFLVGVNAAIRGDAAAADKAFGDGCRIYMAKLQHGDKSYFEDQFASCSMDTCRSGKDQDNKTVDAAQRQAQCIKGQTLATSNFPWGIYQEGNVAAAFLPPGAGPAPDAVATQVLPKGNGWFCFSVSPGAGFKSNQAGGGDVNYCERTLQTCQAAFDAVQSGPDWVRRPCAPAPPTAYCHTMRATGAAGYDYRCSPTELSCDSSRAFWRANPLVGQVSLCVPVGDR